MTTKFRIRFAAPLAAGRLRLIGSSESLRTRASSQASVGLSCSYRPFMG